MDRVPVTSSDLAEVGYDPSSMTLEVLFTKGGLYQYFDVPEVVFQELLQAGSKGRYFNQNIKNNYRYIKL
ncbi:MAG: KTSC domain-containing protein [Bdellovibrionales bacterium]|nr:KTSC domain-containing protein [Bdellovibrionales bacterium]